jgi:hypothetical protein
LEEFQQSERKITGHNIIPLHQDKETPTQVTPTQVTPTHRTSRSPTVQGAQDRLNIDPESFHHVKLQLDDDDAQQFTFLNDAVFADESQRAHRTEALMKQYQIDTNDETPYIETVDCCVKLCCNGCGCCDSLCGISIGCLTNVFFPHCFGRGSCGVPNSIKGNDDTLRLLDLNEHEDAGQKSSVGDLFTNDAFYMSDRLAQCSAAAAVLIYTVDKQMENEFPNFFEDEISTDIPPLIDLRR